MKLLRGSLPAMIEIQQHIGKECRPVLTNPTQIHQVVMNLCTNAYHAMRGKGKGGTLTVRLEELEIKHPHDAAYYDLRQGHYVRLCVSDTGHGMPPEIQERIFEPYFTTKEKDEGTGLGLATVHGIVTDHGGAIRVRSSVDAGTMFELFFPSCEEKFPGRKRMRIESLPKGGSERILFVDDEEPITYFAEKTLTRLGYRVDAFGSSEEVLRAFRRTPKL